MSACAAEIMYYLISTNICVYWWMNIAIVENFHVNNLLCLKFLIFVGQGYPRKLFNLEHFPIYGI